MKFGKQFQRAEQLGAQYAIVIGSEFPELKIKNLAERSEETTNFTEDFAALVLDKLA